MDINSLYNNIPLGAGISILCKTYETFYGKKLPIPTHFLREMLRIILKDNSFHFNGKNHLQTHGTPMGTKWQYLANILMVKVETDIIKQSPYKPLIWKGYIDNIFSRWNINQEAINNFTKLKKGFHSTIKFTAEISDTEITYMYIQGPLI